MLYRWQRSRRNERTAADIQVDDSIFPHLDVSCVLQQLEADGVCPNITLPYLVVDDILSFIQTIDYFPDHDLPGRHRTGLADGVDPTQYGHPCSRARYPESFLDCPAVQRIANDPVLLSIASQYLGRQPLHSGSRLWWSFADAPPYDLDHAGQRFHYDIDDYRALRFFFYLTDVDTACGPHVVVRGSHNHKRFRDRLSLSRFRSDEDLADFYGQENLVTLCGKAGFGFAEDPQIFHKGTPPQQGERLILLIRYVVNDWSR